MKLNLVGGPVDLLTEEYYEDEAGDVIDSTWIHGCSGHAIYQINYLSYIYQPENLVKE